jgi:hypothetical protein
VGDLLNMLLTVLPSWLSNLNPKSCQAARQLGGNLPGLPKKVLQALSPTVGEKFSAWQHSNINTPARSAF